MKVAFITGCLEPGKDGVGDYSRHLAKECERQGVSCCAVALNDPYVPRESLGVSEGLRLLRLGPHERWIDRIRLAEDFLSSEGATHVSFQFVPYAFHRRGFAWDIAKYIPTICGARHVHLMLHEVWVGSSVGCSLKERGIGLVQRFFVKMMLRQLRPTLVSTTNPVYQRILEREGICASTLPLFGHVPPCEDAGSGWVYEQLRAAGADITETVRQDAWIFGMFGTLHPVWCPDPFLPLIITAARDHRMKLIFLSVGRLGDAGEALWRSMAAQYGNSCTFCVLGERSPRELADVFSVMDFGVAATPWSLIGKSGSVAAMIDHGLPVIVTRDEVKYPFRWDDTALSPLLLKLTPEIGRKLPAVKRQPPTPRITDVANNFIRLLESIKPSRSQNQLRATGAA